MHTIPVFFDVAQAVTERLPSPSAQKPPHVVASWQRLGLPVDVRGFEPVTEADLRRAHDPGYVTAVLSKREANGFGTFSAAVAESLKWTVGSFVAAAQCAWKSGTVACSPTSGFHHAEYAGGGGYCTFNGLMVAAHRLLEAGVGRVGVLDCDAHYGNGTVDIMERVPGLEGIAHYTRGSEGYVDNAEAFLGGLHGLLTTWRMEGVEVVLYQAGADPHVNDPLGGLLTTAQMHERDRIVFRACRDLGLAVAWNLAGGYQERRAVDFARRLRPVLDLHDNTMRACVEAWVE
jgi:acetoin utilization deacetylase AcuC-like enzyme